MALKPDASIMTGLAVMTVVVAVHSNATPTQADIQALPAGTPDIDRAERKATVAAAGFVAGISLLAKDPTIFLMGTFAVVGMAVWTRHSNYTESVGGKYLAPAEASAAGSANTGPAMEDATEDYHMFQGASVSDFVR